MVFSSRNCNIADGLLKVNNICRRQKESTFTGESFQYKGECVKIIETVDDGCVSIFYVVTFNAT